MIRHTCMNIEGAMRNAIQLRGCITVDGKTLETVKEVRDFLKGELAKGRRVLPMCRCSNFDYQHGCRGHEKNEEWLDLKRIGLNNPTEVEYEGKTLITVGLSIEQLVETWRDSFNLHDCNIFLEMNEDTFNWAKEKWTDSEKSIEELFAEQDVFLRKECEW